MVNISEKWLNCLTKKGVLSGVQDGTLEKCSYCMEGKQTRVSFKKKAHFNWHIQMFVVLWR